MIIKQLDEEQVISYLTGYGIDPLPTGPNPSETDHLRREYLIRSIGAPRSRWHRELE
jgi:hypothetical protein